MNGVTAPAPSTKSGESPRLDAHVGCRTGEELLLVSIVFPFPKFKLWSMSHHSLCSIRCFHAYLLQYFLFIFRVQLVLNSSLSSGCDCCCGSYHSLNHSARLYSCFYCRWRGRCMMESWQTGNTFFLRSYLRFIVAWLPAISIPHSTHRTIYSSHMLLYILGTYRGPQCKYPEHFVHMVLRRKDAHKKPKQFTLPSNLRIIRKNRGWNPKSPNTTILLYVEALWPAHFEPILRAIWETANWVFDSNARKHIYAIHFME